MFEETIATPPDIAMSAEDPSPGLSPMQPPTLSPLTVTVCPTTWRAVAAVVASCGFAFGAENIALKSLDREIITADSILDF